MGALLDVEDFRTAARDGSAPEATLLKFADSEPAAVAGASARTRRFVFSTADVDHSNDVIRQDGWDLGIFRRNPVALFAHDSSALPIGRASNVAVVGGKLMGDIEFAGPETYEFADTVFQLVKGGFLKAVSVGFMPKDWKFTGDKNRPNGLDFIKQVLCEISVCAIPANPHALIAARASGIDTRALRSWAERVLDEGTSPTPRGVLESLRSQAAEPRCVVRSAGMANDCIDSLNASIADNRQTLKNMAAIDPADCDQGMVDAAVGHVKEAVARQGKAVASLRDALARPGANANPDAAQQDSARDIRIRDAEALRLSVEPLLRAETPEERVAEARRLAGWPTTPPTTTRAQRLRQVREARRYLEPLD